MNIFSQQSSPVPSQPHTSATLERLAAQQAAFQRYNDAWAAFRADESVPAIQQVIEVGKELQAVLSGGVK